MPSPDAPTHSDTSPRENTGHSVGADRALQLPDLAHELNSLLDGSLRCVNLAERALSEIHAPPNAQTGDVDPADLAAATVDGALARLRTARDGMRHMTELLMRAMSVPAPTLEIFADHVSLAELIRRVVDALHPMAQEHAIEIVTEIAPPAERMPGSMLGIVIANGVRNAIESCAADSGPAKRIEVLVTVNASEEVVIMIADNGTGIAATGADPPVSGADRRGGHGIGLNVCRRIVSILGGRLRLYNVPFGKGAVLQVELPMQRLVAA